MENRIKVIDSYPGSGKTSFAIQCIQTSPEEEKIIYITPFLSEVGRIIDSCPNKNFVQPDKNKGKGSKLNHLISLVSQGKNIVSTHALFTNITDELIGCLKLYDYVLYLDEAFQTVDKYDILDEGNDDERDMTTKQDVNTLLLKELISVDEEFHVVWKDDTSILSRYEQFKNLADRGLLYYINGSLLLWSFPIEVFREGIFSEIIVMTYQFKSQLQAYYYDYFGIEYKMYHVEGGLGNYKIVETQEGSQHDIDWRRLISKKINVLDNPKLNRIGDSHKDAMNRTIDTALSVSWYQKNKELVPVLRDNMYNFFNNISKSKASQRLWTSFKEHRKLLKSNNVSTRSWLALNARATNDYGDRICLAYLINRYVDPFYEQFFYRKNIAIDNDQFALSEMIQWIWRSAIRNDIEITIYIPSVRMRNLLTNFLTTS